MIAPLEHRLGTRCRFREYDRGQRGSRLRVFSLAARRVSALSPAAIVAALFPGDGDATFTSSASRSDYRRDVIILSRRKTSPPSIALGCVELDGARTVWIGVDGQTWSFGLRARWSCSPPRPRRPLPRTPQSCRRRGRAPRGAALLRFLLTIPGSWSATNGRRG